MDSGTYYGVAQQPSSGAASGSGTIAAPGQADQPQTPTTARNTAGIHQNPVFVIVVILALAFVLSRLAEHGAGFGIYVKGKA
jgi:hypothetical protein